jgi:hypothetical protein
VPSPDERKKTVTIGLDDLVSDADRLTPARAAYVKAQLMTTIAGDVRRRRMVRTGVGVGAAATVAASALYVTIGSAPPASASWNAVPRAVAISLDDPMVQQCLHELPGGPAAQVGSGTMLPAVAEARGSSRAALLDGSDSQAFASRLPRPARAAGRWLRLYGVATSSPSLATVGQPTWTVCGTSTVGRHTTWRASSSRRAPVSRSSRRCPPARSWHGGPVATLLHGSWPRTGAAS